MISDQLKVIDTHVIPNVTENMCSVNCPCPQNLSEPWTNLNETQLNAYKRTGVTNSGNAVKDASGNTFLKFIDTTNLGANDKVFLKASECLDYMNGLKSEVLLPEVQRATAILEYYEQLTSYCTGMCIQSLFYLSRSVDKGIPQEPCNELISEDVKQKTYYLAAISFATGFILFFVWIAQYVLWANHFDVDPRNKTFASGVAQVEGK